MRFIHCADIHLGAAPDAGKAWSQTRSQEIWKSFERLIREVSHKECELLLIAGDLFHRQPLMRELKEVNYLFSTIENTSVILIAGNHDYLKPDSYYRNFTWSSNVTCLYSESLESVYLKELNTEIFGLSYHRKEIQESLYNRGVKLTKGRINILLAHGGDEKHIPIQRKQLGAEGYDYIALGHIHKPEILIPELMAYAGSLEPIDSNEVGIHGYILGEITDKRKCVKLIPFAVRNYIHLRIRVIPGITSGELVDKIKEKIVQCGRHHLYKIFLTGFRDPDIRYETDRIMGTGQITEVLDMTEPDYHFDQLLEIHGDDMIGRYINYFKQNQISDPADRNPVRKKALYYGIQAMLEAEHHYGH